MLLTVDIGNTQTSFGIFDENRLLHHWRGQTRGRGTADEWASFFFPLLHHHGLLRTQVTAIALCSVVPTADAVVERFCLEYFQLRAFWIRMGIRLPYSVNVDFPEEIGADRLANTAYAVSEMKLPSIVVDIGTAMTFDVISKDRVYEGGLILPGMSMGIEGLGTRTSKLPLVELTFPKNVIGKNTIDCIRSGILFGYCDLVDGLIDRIIQEMGQEPSLALTGGDASLIHGRLRHKTDHLPNLTLDGIRLLYNQNI